APAHGRAPDGPEDPDGCASRVRHVAYETGTRHYAHADLPGRADHIPHMIAGAAGLDGAVLVVSALDGVRPQTAEHLLLARQAGVRHVVVALTKAEAGGPELTELVELDTRALLTAHGFDGQRTAVVRVSARRALAGDPRWTGTVEALLDAVDTYVPTPGRPVREPFLLPVERVLPLPGGGAVVAGTIERGAVRPGDRLEIAGGTGGPRVAPLAGLETFGRPMAGARAGDTVALLLPGVPHHEVRRGDVVAAPGSLVPRRRCPVRVRLLPPESGGAGGVDGPVRFHFRTADVPGTLVLGPDRSVPPGATVPGTVLLDRALPLDAGLPFAVREGGRTVGVGTVATAE
ncbi:GTP-binding protein, partial [Streptomyces sp. UNOC14_S4]|uniref:GTP-binding protein n=1 Tax=Streptomyces sp. UNOC14_S4 TaxID=2872340 RepID=UPI001E5060F9